MREHDCIRTPKRRQTFTEPPYWKQGTESFLRIMYHDVEVTADRAMLKTIVKNYSICIVPVDRDRRPARPPFIHDNDGPWNVLCDLHRFITALS